MKLSDEIPVLPSNLHLDEMYMCGGMTVTDRAGHHAKININDIFDLLQKMAGQYGDKDAIAWINDFNNEFLNKIDKR